MPSDIIPSDYAAWLAEVKSRIQSARSRAALAVNFEVIRLYHSIGCDILERQTRHGWGSKVISRIAADLKAAFPDIKGFSTSNIKYMRFFAEHCPAPPLADPPGPRFGQQPADQLPWFHVVTLLTRPICPASRSWRRNWPPKTLPTWRMPIMGPRPDPHPSSRVDHLLDVACLPDALTVFKSLCRHYWEINPQATASYIHAYREMWDPEDIETKESGHE